MCEIKEARMFWAQQLGCGAAPDGDGSTKGGSSVKPVNFGFLSVIRGDVLKLGT